MTKPLPGSGYIVNSTKSGFSFDILQDYQSDGNITQSTKINPFDCIIEKVVIPETDPVQYEHRLKVVQGICPAFVYDAFTDESTDGAITYLQAIINPNIYPTDSRVTGSDINSVFMDEGGYLKLTPENDYMLFLFLLQPGYVDAPSEFRAIHLVLSKIGIGNPNEIIDTLQAKCFFSGGATTEVGMAYTQSWCIRDNIAQFVWDATAERFVIYQYTNSPKLFYPVFNTTGTSAGDTYTDPMISSFSGYTKDLVGGGNYILPAEQNQFPPLHN